MTLSVFIFVIIICAFLVFINDLLLFRLYFKDCDSMRSDLRECYELMEETLKIAKEVNDFCLNQYTFIDDQVEDIRSKVIALITINIVDDGK